MKLTTREDHGQPSDPRAGHKMTDDQGGHDRHAGHSVAMFRDKFWLSFALTIPVVIWSSDVQGWFGYTAPSFPGSKLIPRFSERWSSSMVAWFSSAGLSANWQITSLA